MKSSLMTKVGGWDKAESLGNLVQGWRELNSHCTRVYTGKGLQQVYCSKHQRTKGMLTYSQGASCL